MKSNRVSGRGRPRPFFFLLSLVALWFAVGVVRADKPSEAPMLRIETGMHTAIIRSIGTDAAGRWLLTTAEDKTARLWDAHTGALLQTYRPPIGPGNEGRLEAGALSPDGRWVAVSGWTQLGSRRGNTLYLFDRASGRMVRRLSELPNTVFSLAFSPDAAWLAAGMYGFGGVRLWRTDIWAPVAGDREYSSDIYGLDFHGQGEATRLAVSSYDGGLRLYRVGPAGLERLLRVHAPGGRKPYGIRFTPEGQHLAVGYADVARVDVVHTANLRRAYVPDLTSLAAGALASVAWWPQEGGAPALVAGSWSAKDGNRIIIWPERGRGASRQVTVSRHDVSALAPLPDGGLAWASEDPAWGILGADGQSRLLRQAALSDFSPDALHIDASGTQVRIGEVFSIAERRFLDGEAESTPIVPRTDGLDLQGWRDGASPTLGGMPLQLEPHEMVRSLAISPDGSHFVLGSDWNLRLYSATGRELWRRPAPGPTRAVNLTADGQIIVAAYGDGTIRWHRRDDGRERLALFPHPDRKRWVMWTPEGFYDASPGGEDLIGWHVNRGAAAAADFFPASRFRSRHHHPDAIDSVFASSAEVRPGHTEKLVQALPPVAHILSPTEGQTFSQPRVSLRYSVRTAADAPLTGVKVLVDGRPAALARGLKPEQGESAFSLEISLPERDVVLSLIPENRHGTGAEASVRLKWAGTPAFVAKPALYVLAIGVAQYREPGLALDYPAKDARDFAAAMQQQTGLYREVIVKVLPEANAREILEGLDWLRSEVTAKDVGMLFLAGHGVNDADGDYYFLPVDADSTRLRQTAVPTYELQKTLSRLPGKTLAFIDTCHAGNVLVGNGDKRRGLPDIDALVNELAAAENGAVVFASSSGRQSALENRVWQNGAFTKALLEGLAGQADYTRDGAISINELDTWLAYRVKQLTGNRQTPTTTKPNSVPDFPIATLKPAM